MLLDCEFMYTGSSASCSSFSQGDANRRFSPPNACCGTEKMFASLFRSKCSRRRRVLLLAGFTLHGNISAKAIDVEWRVSIAADAGDESCSDVCRDFGLACTERCWPADLQGLNEVMYGSFMKDVCFRVETGSPQIWNPAKDPRTKICYWNPGPVTGPRCPETPSTPLELQGDGSLRRICPCLSYGVSQMTPVDCGLGQYAAAPVNAPDTQFQSSPTPMPTASPEKVTTTLRLTTSAPTTSRVFQTGCVRICVRGFAQNDVDLNGEYERSEAAGVFSHWSQSGNRGGQIAISREDNGRRWKFKELQPGGGSVHLAQGTLGNVGSQNSEMPLDGTFITQTAEFDISFECCGTYSAYRSYASGGTSASATAPGEDKQYEDAVGDEGGSNVIVGVCIAAVACVALAISLTVAWYRGLLAVPRSLRRHNETTAFKAEGPESWDATVAGDSHSITTTGSRPKGTWATKKPEVFADPEDVSVRPFMNTWRGGSGPELPLHSGFDGTKAATTCPNGFGRFNDGSGGKDDIGNLLGRKAPQEAAHGFYEGPVRPWWGNAKQAHGAQATKTNGPSLEREFRKGLEVRLKDIHDQPTWNGTEGVVEGHENGFIIVRCLDGRTKGVLPAQCELLSPRADSAEEEGEGHAAHAVQRSTWGGTVPYASMYGSSAPKDWRSSSYDASGTLRTQSQDLERRSGPSLLSQRSRAPAMNSPAIASAATPKQPELPKPPQSPFPDTFTPDAPRRGTSPWPQPSPPPAEQDGNLLRRAAATTPASKVAKRSGVASVDASPPMVPSETASTRTPGSQREKANQNLLSTPALSLNSNSLATKPVSSANGVGHSTLLRDDLQQAQRSVQAQLDVLKARLANSA